jgi:hypothetical protein
MPRARLSVALPEATWIRALSESHPDARFRVLAALPDEGAGVGLVEVEAGNLREIVREMAGQDGVETVEPLRAAEASALLQFETTHPLLLLSAQESGVPLEPPVDIRDGRATFEVTATRERLSGLEDALEAMGMPLTVEWIHESGDPADLLTDRQRDVLLAALDAGYYTTPRECTLTELADRLGTAKSTLSETLRRAESHVVERYAEQVR